MRELENKVSDLSEDLEAERAAHKRTDKLKRDLNEVSSGLCLKVRVVKFEYSFRSFRLTLA